MNLYIVDAFAEERFGGNQAGVVLTDTFPSAEFCRKLDAELKFSETAFVRRTGEGSFHIRYFTPTGEVPLCGHATVASFSVLRDTGVIGPGDYTLHCLTGDLIVSVSETHVLMDMAKPALLRGFSEAETAALYAAFELSASDAAPGLAPKLVSTGLADIMLSVADAGVLDRAAADMDTVAALSARYEATGVHMFCPDNACLARCRNFAPLFGIPEESATGTANGALTYYLSLHGLVRPGVENRIIQGEKMGRPSVIKTLLTADGLVRVGGSAVIVASGVLN